MTQPQSPTRRSTLQRLALVGVALATFAALPSVADANRWAQQRLVRREERRNPNATTGEHLEAAANRVGMGVYARRMPNGARRVYLNPSNQRELEAVEAVLHGQSNTLQILHMSEGMHSLALWNGRLLHLQYSNGGQWRLRQWGHRLRTSNKPLYSAVIQLTPTEGASLDRMLAAAEAEQGSPADAPNEDPRVSWGKGHIKGALGQRNFNCTSGWCGMPVGDAGEALFQIVGLGYNSGSPHDFQRSLERVGNDRVPAVIIYGPKDPSFGKNPDVDQTFNFPAN